MAKSNATCAACLRMQARIGESARDRGAFLKCEFGLTEAAVPLKLGEELIGYLVTGQVFLQQPSASQVARMEAAAKRLGLQETSEAARNAFIYSRVMPRRQLEAAMRLLEIFAEQLAMMSNVIATRASNADPLAVVRAKHFIRENLQEDISLQDIARAACTSTFYICKLFKKHTGINLTEYISRLRVERSRELLANPNLRVSEIAFEVGFQSLTHFNRVFRKIVGEAPTDHREHLSLAAAA